MRKISEIVSFNTENNVKWKTRHKNIVVSNFRSFPRSEALSNLIYWRPRVGPAPAPRAPPRDALWTIYSSRRKNPNPRRIFPNTIQSSAAITDKFWGFRRSCSDTLPGRGSTARAISINAAASRDEERVVPHRG